MRAPAVVVDVDHRRFPPCAGTGLAIAHAGGDRVVAVAEHVRLDGERIPDHALDRKAPAVEFRRHLLDRDPVGGEGAQRSEEHTSELQSLMRISYAVFCLKKKNNYNTDINT